MAKPKVGAAKVKPTSAQRFVGAISAALLALACYQVIRRAGSQPALVSPEAVSPARAALSCVDSAEDCAAWARSGECDKNTEYMRANCARSCGRCAADAPAAADSAGASADSELHARAAMWPKCKNKVPECGAWVQAGECDKNPRYMKIHCALACDTCDFADFGTRCVIDPLATPAVQPGDMDAMFERISTSAEIAALEPRVLSREPWVVVFDEFMSAEEADAVLAVSNREDGVHFKASQGTGSMDEDGTLIPTVSSYRTSFTNWCEDDCLNETAVKRIRERIEAVTGVPDDNHEFPQVLRYQLNQYYHEHHDYIPAHRQMPCGPRVYTFFLYLNDVEEGGFTSFPRLNISVQPKKGRAVLWPSTLNERPLEIDERTQHVAEPVVKGTKFSVNMWLHMFGKFQEVPIGTSQ